jgi:beta-glucosidase
MTSVQFSPDFIWGTATSAYQIEGGWDLDGRKPSIWDTFCHQPGHIRTGETGDVAADHYHRWAEDVELMSQIGLKAYRFSVAWTRVIPDGSGPVNPAGLDFYDRLVDGLLAKGIIPYPTLFHYDLPQPLQDQGGWPRRDTAQRFGDYAQALGKRLGDRVSCWITHNEPWVTAVMGYFTGEHAPGKHNPFAAYTAAHNLLLSHGYAVQALRAASQIPTQIGIALNLSPVYPASGQHDLSAVKYTDAMLNRLFLDPLLKGRYPEELTSSLIWRWLERNHSDPRRRVVQPGDMEIISTPLDFVGVNYYSRSVVRYLPFVHSMPVRPRGSQYSQMWEIYPGGIYDLLLRLHTDYERPNWIVSENGIPVHDLVEADGSVHDTQRIAYLRDHLSQIHRAMTQGVPVSGYFVWSLLDNFEWVWGYSRRFGLIYVNFKDQTRILKDSARWYAQVIRENGIETESGQPTAGEAKG